MSVREELIFREVPLNKLFINRISKLIILKMEV